MFEFIKYEWWRRWKFFLTGIIIFIVVNVDIISRMQGKNPPGFVSGILYSVLFALVAVLVLDQISRLYRTLFTDEGYMELTLPLSGYKLLGAKFLAVVLECIAVIIIVGIVLYADLQFMVRLHPDIFNFTSLDWESISLILQIVGYVMIGYLIFILTVYFSLTLAKSIFAAFKHGKLIAFGCFLVITRLLEVFPRLIINSKNLVFYETTNSTDFNWLVTVVIMGMLFGGTAYLLDRKINL